MGVRNEGNDGTCGPYADPQTPFIHLKRRQHVVCKVMTAPLTTGPTRSLGDDENEAIC